MKKLLFLLLINITVGACNSEKTPNNGSNGNGSSITATAIVEDGSGKRLGLLISGNSSSLNLISPKGYYYAINYDGRIDSPSILLTDSKSKINKNNLYVMYSYTNMLVKKSAYIIKSTTGELPNGELFCHEDSRTQTLVSGYYRWNGSDKGEAPDFEYSALAATGGVGVKITNCSYDQVGIPQNIQLPIKIIG